MYSPEERAAIYKRICDLIASGESIGKICQREDMPVKSSVFLWLRDDPEFSDQYVRAREARAEARVDRIDELTQEVRSGKLDANAARVIIDAEKWQAGKENAKRYGDKLQVEADITQRIDDEQLGSKLAFLLGKAGVAVPTGGSGEEE